MRIDDGTLEQLASDAATGNSSCTGYLAKKGGNSSKWQQRWFVLSSNMLFYFENERSRNALGCILLEKAVVTVGPDERNAFFFTIQGYGASRKYVLYADSAVSRKLWLHSIEASRFDTICKELEDTRNELISCRRELEELKEDKRKMEPVLQRQRLELKKAKKESTLLIRHLSRTIERRDSNLNHRRRSVTALAPPDNDDDDDSAKDDSSECNEVIDAELEDTKRVIRVQSLIRAFICARRWREAISRYRKTEAGALVLERNRIIHRLQRDEVAYVNTLDLVCRRFKKAFELAAQSRKPLLTLSQVAVIFCNIEQIHVAHKIFLEQLNHALESWPTVRLGEPIHLLTSVLAVYNDYVRNIGDGLSTLTSLKSNVPDFRRFLENLEYRHNCMLEQLLALPLDKMMSYVSTLTEIIERSDDVLNERSKLMDGKLKLSGVMHAIQERTSETERLRRVLRLERQFAEGNIPQSIFLDPESRYVKEGNLNLLTGGNPDVEYCCILLSKYMIVAEISETGLRPTGPGNGIIPLAVASVTVLEGTDKYGKTKIPMSDVFEIKWEDHVIALSTPSETVKYHWVTDIEGCIQQLEMLQRETTEKGKDILREVSDVQFSEGRDSDGFPIVIAASLDRVMSIIIPDGSWWPLASSSSMDQMKSFLMIFRRFVSPQEFLTILFQRFHDANDDLKNGSLIHQRIFGIFHQWVSKHFYDFREDPALQTKLMDWLTSKRDNAEHRVKVERLLDLFARHVGMQVPHPPELPMLEGPPLSISRVDPKVLAEQLTWYHFELYRLLQPRELMQQAWTKKDKATLAPGILRLSQHSNHVQQWVVTTILDENLTTTKLRAQALKHFLNVAGWMLEMNNFYGVGMIYGALSSCSVHRMKRTWAELNQKRLKTYQTLEELFSPSNDHQALRHALGRATHPCIPYLGMYLTKLFFMEEKDEDYLKFKQPDTGNAEHKLINIMKCRSIAGTLEMLMQFQSTPYSHVSADLALLSTIVHAPVLSDNAAYSRSLELEPRQSK